MLIHFRKHAWMAAAQRSFVPRKVSRAIPQCFRFISAYPISRALRVLVRNTRALRALVFVSMFPFHFFIANFPNHSMVPKSWLRWEISKPCSGAWPDESGQTPKTFSIQKRQNSFWIFFKLFWPWVFKTQGLPIPEGLCPPGSISNPEGPCPPGNHLYF